MVEGVYGGWGNFGLVVVVMILLIIVLVFGGFEGWCYVVVCIGILVLIYGFVYFFWVWNIFKGFIYFKLKKFGGLEVFNKKDFYFYLVMNVLMYIVLVVLSWKLGLDNLKLFSEIVIISLWVGLVVLFVF